MIKVLFFSSGAILSQGVTALTGLLLARWLSVADYGIYTIFITVSGAIAVLTKGGINLGFTAIVGRTWPDRSRAAQALGAALQERKVISVITLPFVLTVAAWLLYKNNASEILISMLLIGLTINWFFDLKIGLFDQVLIFSGRQLSLQTLETFVGLIRLIFSVALHFANLLTVFFAVAINVLSLGLKIPFIARWIKIEIPIVHADGKSSDRKEIHLIAIRYFPLAVFYCLQSQIALLIISINSDPSNSAAFGALSRIAQLLAPIALLVNAYAVPRFTQEKKNLLKALFKWTLLALVPGLLLITVAYFHPKILLWLVGPNYTQYKDEVFILCLGAALSSVAGLAWSLVANRGWTRWALLQIPVFIVWCIFAPRVLDLSSLNGILWFQLGFPIALIVTTSAEIFAAYFRCEL